MLAIGVDLGGTKIETALVDKSGNVLKKERVLTQATEGPDKILENLNKAIDAVKTEEVVGIGIGTPGFIWNNKMASNPNVPGLDVAIHKFLKHNPEAIIENDANCFALSEHMFGAGKDCDNMIGVIWGTGIGGGIIVDGILLKGANGGAGEFGHITIDCNITHYEPGGPSTWEYLCSGPNIVRRYKEASGPQQDPNPSTIFDDNDPIAQRIKQDTITFMGMALGNLVNTVNPKLIVMGGGVSNCNVYDELNEAMRKYSIGLSGQNCKVVKNSMGDSSGVLGAAALVFKKF